jgi:hypothetical protein
LVCCDVSAAAEGWLLEDDGWLVEDDGWLVEALGWLVEADDGFDADNELVVSVLELMLDEVLGVLEALEALGELDDDEADCSACFEASSAAWVRGPMMPSIGPGSKPLSFSDCWSCFTDSSPAAFALAGLADVSAEALLEADVSAAAPLDVVELAGEAVAGCDDCDCALAPDCFAGWLSAAKTVPAAMSAATSASFFISMDSILSREVRPGTLTQLPCPPRTRKSGVTRAIARATRSRSGALTAACADRRRSHA